jgi:glycosyltransferase involved in cell wall biosynthesis
MPAAGPLVEVILPCLNEERALPWVLSRVPSGIGVIVVDNGSTDRSVEIAADFGARVVDADLRGYGAACHAGLLAASAPVVAVMDADASLDPAQLERVVGPVVSATSDLVLGSRRPVESGAQPWHLRWANRALTDRIERRTGVRLHDLGPVRAARRAALLGLGLLDRRSGYPAETVVRAADAGWRIDEVWVDYHRRTGRSKVTGSALGFCRAVHDMSAVLAR